MTTIANYRNCSTGGIRALDLQLIAQIQRIAPGVLVRCDHLPVALGAGCHPYLQAPAVEALDKAIRLRSRQMKVNSAYRTLAQQAVLYAHYKNRRCGIRAAALPGRSNHNTALAIDVEDADQWRPYLERFGWDWIGSFDPMHFDFEGFGGKNINYFSILAFQQIWNRNYPKLARSEDGTWGGATEQALMQTLISGFGLGSTVSVLGSTHLEDVAHESKIASMRIGDRSKDVLLLQARLNGAGFGLVEDGEFGKATLDAVKEFQRLMGLVVDGVVGMATKKAWLGT